MAIKRLLPLLFVIPALTLPSCGPQTGPAQAKVSGSLKYKGQPIKAGTMAFHSAEGQQYQATISDDGTYSATDVPVGELVVTVDTSHLDPNKTGAAQKPKDLDRRMAQGRGQQSSAEAPATAPQPYLAIPKKYSNPKTSTLSITLQNGRNVKDLELTD
jgi:hypothetical protein